ncbi:transcriptional regulator, LysR family [Methylobacterium sp. 4-46]|uniref:LysR family transcriptional regulator n=1 Tax=unclassified Methylobacterium TaxID=2615210 RepID=UPI000152D022|nr:MULTISPECIES: LysR family transcriptional regulator [Methylobacterium]ACA15044.1 transcriptional regulator, LysR family [Methylobacterium sp. 4-46]WFT80782.1 LysR family transcriptional regulator [Methylobacterium nodulans]
MESWDAWQTLLAVARTGRLSAAAGRLGIDATTAGRRVRRLEAALGRPLLAREGGLLVPTRTCLALMPRLEAAERALREVAGEAASDEAPGPGWRPVRVTAVAVLCDHLLAPAVPRLLAARPALGLDLIAEDRNLSLTRREADLALRLGPPARGAAAARPVGRLDYAVFAAAGEGAPERLPWAALDGALAHLPEVRFAERAAGRAGPRHRVSRLETLLRLTRAGGVRAVLPEIMAGRDPALRRLAPAVSRPIFLIGHPEDEGQPLVRAVASWIEGLLPPPADGPP